MFLSKTKRQTRFEKFVSTLIIVSMSFSFLLTGIPSRGEVRPNTGSSGIETAEAAETTVSGSISQDTTWTLANSPYIVTGNVLVNSGATLTIEPGVTVKFDAGKSLQVDGMLIAQSTEDNKITFTKNSTGNWGYILFSDSNTDATYDGDGNYTGGSILEYAVVEYAGDASVSNNGAIRIDNSAPYIKNSTIKINNTMGINIFRSTDPWNAGTVNVLNSDIINNNPINNYNNLETALDAGGVYAEGSLTLKSCTVSDNNGRGVVVNSVGGGTRPYSGPMTLKDNVINNNTGTGVYAYYSVMLTSNLISNNGGGGFYGYGGTISLSNNEIKNNVNPSNGGGVTVLAHTSPITLTNNVIYNNVTSLIGGGVDIEGTYNGGTVTLQDNTIYNNQASSHGGGVDVNGTWVYGAVNLQNNIIYNNTASEGGGIYVDDADGTNGTGSVTGNSIIGNSAQNSAAVRYRRANNQDFKNNTIAGNRATGIAPTYATYIGSHPLFNNNNIFNNTAIYELWNDNPQGSTNLNAENNWWGTASDSDIQNKIYDWFDDSNKGIVDYSPYSTLMNTDAPISPPVGLTATPGTDSIDVNWNANPEPDIAGYRVYWDTDAGYPYANSVDVGNNTNYTLPNLAADKYYFAVTAYDNDDSSVVDDSNTIINEKQTAGNESWFSEEKNAQVLAPDTSSPSVTVTSPSNNQTVSASISINATVDDSASGNSNITEANYSIDSQTASYQMNVPTGSFDSPVESVTANLDTTTLTNGNHTITVLGKDAAGNWGEFASVTVDVQNTPPQPEPHLEAMIDHNWIQGRDFPANENMTVVVNGPETVTLDVQTDSDGNFWLNGWENGFTVNRGSVVDVYSSAGFNNMVVQNINAVADADSNVISGTAFTPDGTPLEGREVNASIQSDWGAEPELAHGQAVVSTRRDFQYRP